MKADGKTKNRLAAERSPYLLQHAENPADWLSTRKTPSALAFNSLQDS